MPVDIAKTRLQSMKYVDGVPEYKGAGDVLAKVIKREGFFSLWKGFTPYYFRLGPHTVLTFIFLEQANKAYKERILGIKGGSGGLWAVDKMHLSYVAKIQNFHESSESLTDPVNTLAFRARNLAEEY